MRNAILTLTILLPLLGASFVHADAPIEGTMKAFIVKKDDKNETLIPATSVVPEQLVEYHLTYVNNSPEHITGLTVIGPVPEGTDYVSRTANSDVDTDLLVSIDGGKTFESEPVVRVITKSTGEVVETIIPATEYTHLKWEVENAIEADGGKQLYTYRVRVK